MKEKFLAEDSAPWRYRHVDDKYSIIPMDAGRLRLLICGVDFN